MTTQPLAGSQFQTPSESDRRLAEGLFNRYLLPRVALAVIAIGSLVGVYLTMSTHGAPPAWALVRWLHLIALGTLAGGAMWWGFFQRRPDLAADHLPAGRFAVAQQQRFRIVGGAALLAAILTAPYLLWFSSWAARAGLQALWIANGVVLAAALGLAGWLLWQPPTQASAFAARRVRLAWGALTLTLALTALLDAQLTFPDQVAAWLLRPIHLVAFGLWFGGAVWNIFIAVPAARTTLALPVVIAAAEQLERFRYAVRVILPTLLITGLLQALPYTGFSLYPLIGSFFGQLILLKLELIAGLFVIFITCPMWRACSPIRGMCDLEDLEAKSPSQPQPARRLDNRGKACAGFVRIRQTLDAMRPGEVLELLSTDSFSWWELPAWLEKQEYPLIHSEQSGRLWWKSYRFLIQKG
jgi:TusA-related sulfurtransferase